MGALLMYKQRFNQPNFNSTVTKNQAHVAYIATRPGVMKLEGEAGGLFGVMNGEFKNVISNETGIARAKHISQKNMNMFRATISFTTAQAEGLGLNSLDEWQEYIKSQIWTIAKGNKIDIANLEWQAAIHQKRGHPHAHITFWDKNQKIQVQYVSPQAVNKIRCDLIKNTYPQLLQEFYDLKKITEDDLKLSFIEVMNGYEDYLLNLSFNEYLDYELGEGEKQYDVSGLTKTDVEMCESFNEICCDYIRIKNSLPEKGRLAYKLLPKETKAEFDGLIIKIIKSNEKLSRIVENYVSVQLDIAECYVSESTTLEKYRKQYFDDAIKQLANSMLRSMKDVNFNSNASHFRQASNSIFYAFCDLAKLTSHYENSNYSHDFIKGDLSKEAIKEKIIENKDRGIGVEY